MDRFITLRYDKQSIPFPIAEKNLTAVLAPRAVDLLADLAAALYERLEHPASGPAFPAFLNRGDRVTIIVSDITRYTGAERWLPLLIGRINACGIPDRNIAVLFALGIHRAMSREEQEQVVGREVSERIGLHNHDAHDPAQLVALGTTGRGTPVLINRRAAETDKLIVTGTVAFHYLAGFGGGRKAIIPGIAGYETCVANHLLTLDPAGTGRHPCARTAVLDGNPMHEDMVEACAGLPPAFLVNTILNAEKQVVHIVAGDMQRAFMQGCAWVRENFVRILAEPADLVIVSCGGYPKDINFIQSHKTIEYAMHALKPGGVMIVLAACPEGIGNPDFLSWIGYEDPATMIPALRDNFQINGQTAYATLLKAHQATIVLISELPDDQVRAMWQ